MHTQNVAYAHVVTFAMHYLLEHGAQSTIDAMQIEPAVVIAKVLYSTAEFSGTL